MSLFAVREERTMSRSWRRKWLAVGLALLLSGSLRKILRVCRRRRRLCPKASVARLLAGHMLEFLRFGGFTDKFFEALHQDRDEEVVAFWIGSKEYFSVLGVENSRAALQSCHVRDYPCPLVHLLGEASFLNNRGQVPMKIRQELSKFFSGQQFLSYLHRELTEEFTVAMNALPVAAVNFYDVLALNVESLLAKVLFGQRIEDKDLNGGRQIVKSTVELINLSNSCANSARNPGAYADYCGRVSELRADVMKLLAITHAEDAKGEECVLHLLREMSHGGNREVDEALVSAVISMIYVSHDMLLASGFWACFHLALYKEIQDKVADELDDLVGRRFLPSLEEIGNLEYLDCFVLESLRLLSVLPMVYATCSTPFELGSSEIERGTIVCLPLFKTMKDAKEFGPSPNAFAPERFFGSGSIQTKARTSLLCFGVGARNCFGRAVAMLHTKMLVSVLLQRYTIKLATPLEDCKYAVGATNVTRPFKPIYFKFDERPDINST